MPAGDCSLLFTNSVRSSTASLLSSTCTSHIVRFALKMTTMASLPAKITAGTEINYMHSLGVATHGSCKHAQLFSVHGSGRIVILAC